MQIVSFLNVSNPDALEADSGFVFQKLLLEELATRGHRVLLIAPREASALTSVTVLPTPRPATKYHARFGMDWRMVDEITREYWARTDVLLVNQPELASGLKAMSYVAAKRRIPLVSYVHYLPLMSAPDEPLAIDPSLDDGDLGRWSLGLLRTAVECSDVCIVGSAFARRLVSAQVGKPRRIEVIPPPCEPELGQLAEMRPPGQRLRLLYNHRLYDHYGTRQLFSELDRLIDEGVRFEVIVTAPTQWRSPARCELAPDADLLLGALRQKPYVRVATAADRASYHDVLSKAHAGLAPWRQAPLWSMAVVDMLAAGRPVFAPRTGAYSEILASNPDYLWENSTELRGLIRGAAEAPVEPSPARARASLEFWSTSEIARRFEAVFVSLCPDGGC